MIITNTSIKETIEFYYKGNKYKLLPGKSTSKLMYDKDKDAKDIEKLKKFTSLEIKYTSK